MKNNTLVWFRQDLRLRDNPALNFAAQQGKVLATYIEDSDCPAEFKPGGASQWWLHNSLMSLSQSLDGKLHIQSGNVLAALLSMIEGNNINCVVWNRCYEPWQINRDRHIKEQLRKHGVQVKSFNGSLLWEPWEVLKQDGTPYKVFTPYYRRGCLSKPSPRGPLPAPKSISLIYQPESDKGLNSLNLIPAIDWYHQMHTQWKPGEHGAASHLADFLPETMKDYKDARNNPDTKGTSHLSPHLHFGELSPNQVWYAAIESMQGDTSQAGIDCFLSELGWREFSHYLLYHFPDLPVSNFNSSFDFFPWRKDTDSLKAWQTGQTGIPIVDAGMRELWHTGYMHNRVRMVVASFLVKNLLIDWREGERWFWDCLVDADLAANCASWQWVAGSGADAAPYFRIFNPVLQGQKFDKQGHYVRLYCPELAHLPEKYVHCPWEATASVLDEAGIMLGKDYPKPVVDLKASRQRALDALAVSKEQQRTN